MAYECYMDDSSSDGVLVLGGYIASSDSWTEFNKAWKFLLDDLKIEEFKMNRFSKKKDVVSYFYKQAIEEYTQCRIAIIAPIQEIKDAVDSFYWPSNVYNTELFRNPYYLTWKAVISEINDGRIRAGIKDPIKIVFDRQNHQEKEIMRAWAEFEKIATLEEINAAGGPPNFGDSKTILPLQAADFYAWWVRKWFIVDEENFKEKLEKQNFPWRVKRKIPHITIKISKNIIHGVLSKMFPAN